MSFNDLIKRFEKSILEKNSLNKDTTGVDKEILAWISVYKHGDEYYKEKARNILIGIAVNAGMIKNRRIVEA